MQDSKVRRGPTLEQRRANIALAHKARRRQGNDKRIAAVVERAGELTPEQQELLRSLLPTPEQATP